jgi:hypothetical protein
VGLCFLIGARLALWLAGRLNAVAPVSAAMALALFSTADLAINNAPHESTGLPPAVYDALRADTRNETVALLRQRLAVQEPNHRDRVELIGIGYHWPNICMIHGCEHVFGHNPLRLKWFYEATRVGDTVAAADQRRFSPLFPSYRSAVADLFGLRFIATGVPAEQIDSSLRPGDLKFVARTREAYVYENTRALPRVMMLSEWQTTAFNALIESGWPDADPRRTVLLEKAPALPPGFAGGAAVGEARILRYANTDIVVEADSLSGGILVLNDVWHPWWRATIDGNEAEILKANVLFRAVVVPAGRHMVRFSFHPFAGAWKEVAAKIRGRR